MVCVHRENASFSVGSYGTGSALNDLDAFSSSEDDGVSSISGAGSGRQDRWTRTADANDDGRVDLLDALAVVGVQFGGRDGLPEPFGTCGEDPTVDEVTCDAFGACP